MHDNKRLFAYGALLLVGFLLWDAWRADHPAQAVATPAAVAGHLVPSISDDATSSTNDVSAVPDAAVAHATAAASVAQHMVHDKHKQHVANTTTDSHPATPGTHWITLENDVLRLVVNLQGGQMVQAYLKDYPVTLHGDQPIEILSNHPNDLYVAQSGVVGAKGLDTRDAAMLYHTDRQHYVLPKGQDTLVVPLVYRNPHGVVLTKSLVLKRGHYAVQVHHSVANHGQTPWRGHVYAFIERKAVKDEGGFMQVPAYNGASMWTEDKPYDKLSYESMRKNPVNQSEKGGWLAMQQHYFVSAWIPNPSQTSHYYSTALPNNVFVLGLVGPNWEVAPGKTAEHSMTFYVGPEDAKRLEALAPGLKLTVDYGFLWMISVAIFWVMEHIHMVVGNWGWSIVLVTLLIKILFYYPSASSYKSMARMRTLQPKIESLKKRFGDDKQQLGQATMKLYKEEKVNPLGGCLPMLIQIPFFLALYWVLIENVALRQAPFILWIHDLAIKDPYYVLPVLMALSMFIQQKMQPKPADPTQAKVMMLMPVMFCALFATFPAGLVLYWLTNNILSALQQWWVMSRVEKGLVK